MYSFSDKQKTEQWVNHTRFFSPCWCRCWSCPFNISYWITKLSRNVCWWKFNCMQPLRSPYSLTLFSSISYICIMHIYIYNYSYILFRSFIIVSFLALVKSCLNFTPFFSILSSLLLLFAWLFFLLFQTL